MGIETDIYENQSRIEEIEQMLTDYEDRIKALEILLVGDKKAVE